MTGAPDPPAGDRPPLAGAARVLYAGAGLFFVGVAYLGAILPGLPTTPWVLLASYCFGKSSPRLQAWLRRAPFFGRLLADWEAHRGIRPRVKVLAVCMVVAACTASVTLAPVADWVRVAIGCCGLVGVSVILFVVPTVRNPG